MEGKVKRNTMFIRRRDCKERHAIITTTTIGTYTFYRFVILIKLMVTRSESSITLYPVEVGAIAIAPKSIIG